MSTTESLQNLPIPLNRDYFLRSLIRELAGILEQIVGYEEAAGYISLVGQNVGNWINSLYKKELGVAHLSREQVANVLVDLKRRIEGDFTIASQDDEKIVLKCTRCPFEEMVLDRPSMCMMTSNVFGVIAANNLGFAKVVLKETLARRNDNCTVIVYLKASSDSESAEGREYFGAI